MRWKRLKITGLNDATEVVTAQQIPLQRDSLPFWYPRQNSLFRFVCAISNSDDRADADLHPIRHLTGQTDLLMNVFSAAGSWIPWVRRKEKKVDAAFPPFASFSRGSAADPACRDTPIIPVQFHHRRAASLFPLFLLNIPAVLHPEM